MGIKSYIGAPLNAILRRFGLMMLDDRKLYDWQKASSYTQPGSGSFLLPEGAAEYLTSTNPRLKELEARYSTFDSEVTTPSVWTDSLVKPEDVLYFRGDNAYVWQVRLMNMNIMAYALTTYYLKSIDRLHLLEKLTEDELFGVHGFTVDNRLVSRDLLDSMSEIYFLEKHLHISTWQGLSVLDIGAGYGRLAYRMTSALPSIAEYICTDAVPVSTFISEYYVGFRGLRDRVRVVPLDEIEEELSGRSIDIAINIQSFPECRPTAIEWWLSRIAKQSIKYLMIAINDAETLRTSEGHDFAAIVEKSGYRFIAKEPVYADPAVQKYAISSAYYYLFELG
jgi:hypothetical protein